NQRFWDDTQIVDIARSADGVLDPWQITGDIAEGEVLATTMLTMFIAENDWNECRNVVNRSMRDARNAYQDRCEEAERNGTPIEDVPLTTLWEIVSRVSESYDEVREDPSATYADKVALENATATLEALKRLPYARLAFAEEPVGFDFLRKRRTVFTLRGV